MKSLLVLYTTPFTRRVRLFCSAVLLSLAGQSSLLSANEDGGQVFESGKVDKLPIPLNQTGPTYPMDLRVKRIEGKVLIDFLVLPDGTVKSAHALDNSQPEFAAAAVAAVSQWTFKPGLFGGQPVTTKMRIPINFTLSPIEPEPINFAIGPLEETSVIQTGSRGVIIHLEAMGSNALQVQAGRFILTRAQDDTGANLKQNGTSAFYHASVGRTSGDRAESTSRQPISITLMGLAKNAKSLRLVEGRLDVFLPAQDPAATVAVENISSKLGVPIEDPALKKAGVTLVIYDKSTADKMTAAKTPWGPQEYDSGPLFGSDYIDPSLPPGAAQAMKAAQQNQWQGAGPAFAAMMKKMNQMGENDIAIGRRDPEHRIVGLEFQAADGSPLVYNHNGRYHSERDAEKKGFDAYDLRSPLPAGAKMICWLLTENSVLAVPMNLTDVPLPERREKVLPPPASTTAPVVAPHTAPPDSAADR